MKPGREFWTVIVFYRGGNWLAWTYEGESQALSRRDAELAYPGTRVALNMTVVDHA